MIGLDIKMPEEVWQCPCRDDGYCSAEYCRTGQFLECEKREKDSPRPSWCPLVELEPAKLMGSGDSLGFYYRAKPVKGE